MVAVDPLIQRFSYGGTINSQLLALMGRLNGSVLDVGCGVGSWGAELRRQGATQITGIEPSALAAGEALDRYDCVVTAPIEALDLADLGGVPFEHVVAADLLEHLVDPWAILRRLHDWTQAGGQLAVSVPNLRYYKVSLALLVDGRFEYQPHGVMDWTHLRWFTQRSLRHALVHCGWKPLRWDWTLSGRRGTLSRASRGRLDGLWASQLRVVSVRD